MSTTPPSKAQRREEARVQAQRLREEAERQAKRQRAILLTLLVVGLVVVGGVVAFILGNRPEPLEIPDFTGSEDPLAEVTAPATAREDGGIPVGPEGVAGVVEGAEDAVEVVVYADYLCPVCNLFEQTNGATLEELRTAGDVVVEYRPVAILDRLAAGSAYSTRAAAAAALVADRAPEAFVAFNDALFAAQPAEGTTGLTDEEIAGIARGAGVPDDVAADIADRSYLTGDDSFVPWVTALTAQTSVDFPDGFGTPTILVDGENLADLGVDWRQPGALEAAIEAAAR